MIMQIFFSRQSCTVASAVSKGNLRKKNGKRRGAYVYLGLTLSWFNYESAINMSWKYNYNPYVIKRKF